MKTMKKFIKMEALLLAAASCMAMAFTGCTANTGSVSDDENTLQLEVYNRGYGAEGYEAVADRFMELNPGKTISIDKVTDNSMASNITAGPKANTIDMYFFGGTDYHKYTQADSVVISGKSYDNYFESLNDVYNYIPEGESLSIKDKMLDDYEQYHNLKDEDRWTEDTYYTAPLNMFNCGIIYNSKIFEENNWTVPVTTDGLVELSRTINNTKFYSTNPNSQGQEIDVKAFMYCLTDNYWQFVEQIWWAQYDGYKSYTNYFRGQDVNGNYTSAIAASDGRLAMINLIDQLFGTYKKDGNAIVARADSEIFCDPTLATRTFVDTQATFLNGLSSRVNTKGATTALMMPNGDWIENEMYANFADDINSGKVAFKYMKVPVISSIINHNDCQTIENDAELQALIKAIDAGSTALTGDGYSVDQVAYDKILEARTMAVGMPENLIALIPAYASAKELAKDFLKFLYSDEGLEIYAKTTRGQNLAFNYDFASVEGVSNFHKSRYEAHKGITHFVAGNRKDKMGYLGGLTAFKVYPSLVVNCNVSSKSDYIEPTKVFQDNYLEINRLWNSMMSDAGLQ